MTILAAQYSHHTKWVCVPYLVLYCTAGELSNTQRQYANESGDGGRHKAQLEERWWGSAECLDKGGWWGRGGAWMLNANLNKLKLHADVNEQKQGWGFTLFHTLRGLSTDLRRSHVIRLTCRRMVWACTGAAELHSLDAVKFTFKRSTREEGWCPFCSWQRYAYQRLHDCPWRRL